MEYKIEPFHNISIYHANYDFWNWHDLKMTIYGFLVCLLIVSILNLLCLCMYRCVYIRVKHKTMSIKKQSGLNITGCCHCFNIFDKICCCCKREKKDEENTIIATEDVLSDDDNILNEEEYKSLSEEYERCKQGFNNIWNEVKAENNANYSSSPIPTPSTPIIIPSELPYIPSPETSFHRENIDKPTKYDIEEEIFARDHTKEYTSTSRSLPFNFLFN